MHRRQGLRLNGIMRYEKSANTLHTSIHEKECCVLHPCTILAAQRNNAAHVCGHGQNVAPGSAPSTALQDGGHWRAELENRSFGEAIDLG